MNRASALLSRIEAAGLWAYFHKDWLLQVRSQLRPQLPPQYFVFVESETILVTPDAALPAKPVMPDIAVARPERDAAAEAKGGSSRATAAVIELEEPCELSSQYTLLIRRSPENRVVAAIELLSPSNKGISNRFDREKYLQKRDAFLEAGVNLLEIDALTQGGRVLPVSLRNLADYQRNAWTAFHHDGGRRLRGWGWNDQDSLPVLPWVVEKDVEVLVDLPQAFHDACEFNRWQDLVPQGDLP